MEKLAIAGSDQDANGLPQVVFAILLATRFDTISGKLLAICSEQPGVGSMWTPIDARSLPLPLAQALCAWFNSTLGTLGFLARRSTKLRGLYTGVLRRNLLGSGR